MSIELLTLVVLLPLLVYGLPLSYQQASTFLKDKIIAQLSILALALGTLCLCFAPVVTVAILGILALALGTGQDSLLRSMATDMARESDLSTMYSAITMLRAIGGSISGPIYAWLYTVALRQPSDVWLGLPYLVAGVLFLIALGLLSCLEDPALDESDTIDEPDRQPLLG